MSKQIVRVFDGVEIVQRKGDRYFNATQMCQACGKLWGHYFESPATKEFLAALSDNIVQPIFDLVQARKGRNGGTWVHPQIALHLAQWLSPQFAVTCSQWIMERIEEEKDPALALARGRERAIAGWQREGRSEAWIAERLNGIGIRHTFTDVLGKHGVHSWGFGACTNMIYQKVLGGPCQAVKAVRELDRTDNLRDNLNRRELSFVRFAEELASMRMEQDRARGNHRCLSVCKKAGEITANAVQQAME